MTAQTGHINAPLVCVIILNWNGWADTVECVRSIAALTYPSVEAFVVDNGSTDESIARIRNEFPAVKILENGVNLGFAGGNNRGIEHAIERGACYVWLLNNDTTVDPGALTALVDTARGTGASIVGSVLHHFNDQDRIQTWGGGTVNRLVATTAQFESRTTRRLHYLSGTSMLLDRSVVESVGLLDTSFFFYLEDADYCLRASAAGLALRVAEDSIVFHKGGASVNRGSEGRSMLADSLYARSSGVFMARHSGPWALLGVPLRLAAIALRRIRRGQASRIPVLWREFVRGLLEGYKRLSVKGDAFLERNEDRGL